MLATAKDLRCHTKKLLESISRGEEVVITYRGVPHAKLVPFHPKEKNSFSMNPLRGIWKEHKASEDVSAYMDQLRKGREHDR